MYRRSEIRRLAGVPIEVITSRTDLPITFVSWDLSPRGVFLMSDAAPQAGEPLVCSFNLDEAREYCFFGEVARISRSRRCCDTAPAGFGVRFLDAGPLERLDIRSELSESPPALPGRPRDNALTRTMGWC